MESAPCSPARVDSPRRVWTIPKAANPRIPWPIHGLTTPCVVAEVMVNGHREGSLGCSCQVEREQMCERLLLAEGVRPPDALKTALSGSTPPSRSTSPTIRFQTIHANPEAPAPRPIGRRAIRSEARPPSREPCQAGVVGESVRDLEEVGAVHVDRPQVTHVGIPRAS